MVTLLAWSKIPQNTNVVLIIPDQSNQTSQWATAFEKQLFPDNIPIPGYMPQPIPHVYRDDVHHDAIVGLTKEVLKQSEMAQQRYEKQGGPKDECNKVSDLKKVRYLQAGMKIVSNIPKDPSPFMKSIINAVNIGEVQLIITHKFPNHNAHYKLGLCSALHHCIIWSPNKDGTRKSLTSYLMPPWDKKDDNQVISASKIMIDVKDMSESDRKKATCMKGYILKNVEELKTVLTTKKRLISCMWGEDSIVYFCLDDFVTHSNARRTTQ